MSIVGENTKRIIEEKGFKQSAIAAKAGFDPKLFSAMLCDRKIIRDDYIPQIAKALNVDPNSLFGILD